METYELRAYEALGFWTIVLIRVHTNEQGKPERYLLYRGDHAPIDECDPVIRAALLLHRVYDDLSDWLSHQPDDPGVSGLSLVIDGSEPTPASPRQY